MNPAPSSASFIIGSSVWSNVASPVLFWKSAISTETGSCTTGTAGPARQPVRRADERRDDQGRGGADAPRQPPHHRQRLAVVVELLEIRQHVRDRRVAGVGSRLDAARDDPVERLRDRSVLRARRRRRLHHPGCSARRRRFRRCSRARVRAAGRTGSGRGCRCRRAGRPAPPAPARAPCTRWCRPRPRPWSVPPATRWADPGHGLSGRHAAGTALPVPPWPAVRALAASVEPATPKSMTRPSPLGVDHDVGGLEVPMDDAGRVSGHEAGRDAARDLHHARHGQLALAFEDRPTAPRPRGTAS